jgi:hypothetical protein
MPVLNKRELDKAIENGLTIQNELGSEVLSPIRYMEKMVAMANTYYDQMIYESSEKINIERDAKVADIKDSDAYHNVTTREGKAILFEEMKAVITQEYADKKVALENEINSKRTFVIQKLSNYFPTRVLMYPLAGKIVYGIVTSVNLVDSKFDAANISITIALPTDEGAITVSFEDEIMNKINNATFENYDTRVYNEMYSENKINRWNELVSMYNNESELEKIRKQNSKLSVSNSLYNIAKTASSGEGKIKSSNGEIKYVADLVDIENVVPVFDKEDMSDVSILFAPKLREHLSEVKSLFIVYDGEVVSKVYATNDFSGDELIEIYPHYNYLQLTENV